MAILKVQLIHPQMGVLRIDSADPIGLNSFQQTVKRSKGLEGIVREMTVNLGFIKEARTWIRTAFDLYGGPDCEITANIWEFNPNLGYHELYAVTKINFNTANWEEYVFDLVLEQTGFLRKVENGMDLPVSIESLLSINKVALDPNAVINNLPLHSKKIQRRLYMDRPSTIGPYDFTLPGGYFASIDFDNVTIEEIDGKRDPGYVIEPLSPLACLLPIKEDGQYRFTCRINTTVGFTNYVDNQLKFWFQVGTEAPIAFTKANYGVDGVDGNTQYTLDETLDLLVGNVVRIYVENTAVGDLSFTLWSGFDVTPTYLNIDALTSFKTSTVKGCLIFEAAKRCAEYLTDEKDCLVSDLFGRVDIGYPADGQGSLLFLTNGTELRKRPKDITVSLREILSIANGIYGAGIGVETNEDGSQKLRIDHKRKFYDKNTEVINLGKVYKVGTRINYERLFNQFVFGYSSKIDIQKTNTVDAFNTLRRYLLPLRNSKNPYDVSTPIKADGYMIEYQRRLAELTEDGKYDNDNFIIQCIRDGLGYKSKQSEGYDLITGIIDFASSYNLDISPARILQNWREYLAINAIYSTEKLVEFLSGDGNYTMSSTKTGQDPLAENGNVSLFGIDPLFTPWDIYFDSPLSSAEFKAIRNNPYGHITLSDKDNKVYKGFVSEVGITHDTNHNKASFDLIEMFVK